MKKLLTLTAAIVLATFAQAQTSKQLWNSIEEAKITPKGERVIVPQKYKTYHISTELKTVLWAAPNEKDVKLENSQTIIELPMPDGTMKKYRVVYSPVMAPELAAAYPDIKTFNITGVDEPGIYGKIDWTEMGFHAMIRKPGTDVYIDPYCRTNYVDYITYNFSDYDKDPSKIQHCEGTVENPKNNKKKRNTNTSSISPCIGDSLQTYRLAVACTGEYAVAATGLSSPTVGQTLSCIVTTVNRVDGVYETEIASKLVLVATETVVVYTNATTDPFTGNNNANTLINESQTVLDANIGDANYDVGHTFSTGGGGLSTVGGVCQSGQKASSITGSPTPTGDGYDIDYVAHEMGHDFGGDHTFRAVSGSCSGNENPGTMVEPGSGITIMAYAGICAPNDDSTHSIAYFHTISFDEITAYIMNGGGGSACPVITANGNHIPVVTVPANFTIPKSTPFILTGSATDADGDVLTYSWEEIDNNNTGGNWNDGQKPYFRSNVPSSSPSRMFPKLSVVLSSTYTTTIGEFLPTTAQTLNFRMVARDNKMGGGGVCYSSVNTVVNINATAGPFAITYPNATGVTWASASSKTVTWNVNGTSATPINCANVNILISYDGGITFSTLMNNVNNSGSQLITVPTVSATISTCRIKVEAVGNIFFDINDNNFTITAGTAGINTIAATNMAMQLFPNPANEQVQINLNGLNRNEKSNLFIYNMLGQVLLKDVLTGKENYELSYDISSFSKGIYIVEVVGLNIKAVKRLVKQ